MDFISFTTGSTCTNNAIGLAQINREKSLAWNICNLKKKIVASFGKICNRKNLQQLWKRLTR